MAMYNENELNERAGRSCADEIAALVNGDLSPKAIQEQLENYHNSDIADSVEMMEQPGRTRLFRAVEPDKLADIFEYLEPENAARFLNDADIGRTALIVGRMEPDYAADILRELPGEKRAGIIGLLDPELRRKIELIVSFDEDEIGSRMSTNYISLDSGMTVAQATRVLMDQAK